MLPSPKRPSGFTLMELLIVILIIMVLVAFLMPGIWTQYNRLRSDQAKLAVEKLQGQVELFHVDNRRYPTNAEGLFVLLYLPDSTASTPVVQPGMPQPGMPGAADPMMGGSMSAGPDMLGQPQNMGMNPMGQTNPMGMNPMGQTNPMGMNPMGGMDNMMDPMNPMGMNPMGGGSITADGTASTSQWTAWTHNEQLFTQQRRRPTPYITRESDLLDPWRRPFRYDSTVDQLGINQFTGTEHPAIWSAGPDGVDGTDDDIRSWDPEEAARFRIERQQRVQQMQMQGQGMMMGGSGGIGSLDQNNMMPGIPGGVGQPNMMPGVPGGAGQPNMMPGIPGGAGQPNMMPGIPGGAGQPNMMPNMIPGVPSTL